MKIIIAIPSCSSCRIPLLIQTVKSIQDGLYKDVYPVIIADGNPYLQEEANKKLHNVSVILNAKRLGWIYSVNRVFKEFDSEYYIYASDDLVFPPDCIQNAMRVMRKRFSDGFGLVTLAKKNRCPFGLIGRKFADHFPDRQVFCPDYIHYRSDSELQRTVKKLGILAYPPERECRVKHFRMKDETWRFARKSRDRDFRIYHKREEKGYLWGIDFNLITRQ